MKITLIIIRISILCAFISLVGNSGTFSQEINDEFIPYGSPFVKIYSNFHYEMNSGETAIEITRAYFGYKYQMTKNISGKLTLNAESPTVSFGDTLTKGTTSLDLTAYLKHATISFNKGNFTFDFGLIGLKQFKFQEKLWDRRYIFKSFQDENKYGSSADLGAMISYKVSKVFSFDVTVRNGEGYRQMQSDNSYLTGLGLNLKPIEGLTIRGYYDYLKTTEVQTTISHFIGYVHDKYKVGAEYDIQNNNKGKKGLNLSGFSTYASYALNNKIELFGRFDQLSSELESAKPYPGSQIIGGIQYTFIKGVKVALNYHGYMHDNKSKDDKNAIYLNFLYAF